MSQTNPSQFTLPFTKKLCKIIKKEMGKYKGTSIVNITKEVLLLENNQLTIELLINPKSTEKCKALVKRIKEPSHLKLRGFLKKTCSLIRNGKPPTCKLQ